ncbi:hypothetical protein X801_02874 [Opisthorchis viverrini]|uniref:Uncharacterized protein n=1 Tax=Opisthorchis viverrini TaxID=6198 RepID=A0A1S8X3G1_OPIVI|nr:hypothetical protein X801_02874 [Opisthorchis viverrini]
MTIHVAAACGYLDVASVLLGIGVDPDSLDADGWTPAHVAACWRQCPYFTDYKDFNKFHILHWKDGSETPQSQSSPV